MGRGDLTPAQLPGACLLLDRLYVSLVEGRYQLLGWTHQRSSYVRVHCFSIVFLDRDYAGWRDQHPIFVDITSSKSKEKKRKKHLWSPLNRLSSSVWYSLPFLCVSGTFQMASSSLLSTSQVFLRWVRPSSWVTQMPTTERSLTSEIQYSWINTTLRSSPAERSLIISSCMTMGYCFYIWVSVFMFGARTSWSEFRYLCLLSPLSKRQNGSMAIHQQWSLLLCNTSLYSSVCGIWTEIRLCRRIPRAQILGWVTVYQKRVLFLRKTRR